MHLKIEHCSAAKFWSMRYVHLIISQKPLFKIIPWKIGYFDFLECSTKELLICIEISPHSPRLHLIPTAKQWRKLKTNNCSSTLPTNIIHDVEKLFCGFNGKSNSRIQTLNKKYAKIMTMPSEDCHHYVGVFLVLTEECLEIANPTSLNIHKCGLFLEQSTLIRIAVRRTSNYVILGCLMRRMCLIKFYNHCGNAVGTIPTDSHILFSKIWGVHL